MLHHARKLRAKIIDQNWWMSSLRCKVNWLLGFKVESKYYILYV